MFGKWFYGPLAVFNTGMACINSYRLGQGNGSVPLLVMQGMLIIACVILVGMEEE